VRGRAFGFGLCFFDVRTNVYIDGYNLYYRALRNTPYKWLNVGELSRLLLPKHTVQTIKYFTAHAGARVGDPDIPTRQQTYLRALRTLPNLQIILGKFMTNVRTMVVAELNPPQAVLVSEIDASGKPVIKQLPLAAGVQLVKVIRTDEKGSDVNLAAHMLQDAYRKDCDCAVIISDDSDLAEPLRIMTNELRLKVGVLTSHKRPSQALHQYATFFKRIRPHVLAASQFRPVLTDAVGTFHKPTSW